MNYRLLFAITITAWSLSASSLPGQRPELVFDKLDSGLVSTAVRYVTAMLPAWMQKKQPAYVYVHGTGGNAEGKDFYEMLKIVQRGNTTSFQFPDHHGGYKHCALAQKTDIDTLAEHYAQHYNETEQRPLVLLGVSRGAATVAAFLGRDKPVGVAAAIVESPFAQMDDVIEYKQPRILKPLPDAAKHKLLRVVFRAYDPKGEKPVDYVGGIPKHIPVAFVCSQTDKVVPWTSTKLLYDRLKETGHEKAHILILERGSHANLFKDPRYQRFVHAFYREYGLPYDPVLAKEGQHYFDARQAQPADLMATMANYPTLFLPF